MVTVLLNETMPRISVPEDASIEEVAMLVGREVGGAVEQLVGAFTLAFAMPAQVHDSGQTDVTSANVLRGLALRVEQIGSDGPDYWGCSSQRIPRFAHPRIRMVCRASDPLGSPL